MIDLFGLASIKLRYQTHSVAGKKTGLQSISPNTLTLVTWEDEYFHTGGMHNTQTNNERLYAPIKGRYLCWGLLQYTADATGTQRDARVFINGTSGTLIWDIGPTDLAFLDNVPVIPISFVVNLSPGDYVVIATIHNATGALNIGNATTREQFGLSYMGE